LRSALSEYSRQRQTQRRPALPALRHERIEGGCRRSCRQLRRLCRDRTDLGAAQCAAATGCREVKDLISNRHARVWWLVVVRRMEDRERQVLVGEIPTWEVWGGAPG